tara:strand:- start:556 stop:750 length:195 start_codon:yes stop_codon:yes gene_type:complete
MSFTVETEYHTIDFTNKKAYKAVLKVCKENGINLDHYFLEFDTQDTEPEAYEMSDAWDSVAEDV